MENPILDATKINNILSNSKKYDVKIVGVILHFFVQMDIFNMLKTESRKLISILDKVFCHGIEIGLDFVEIPFMGKTKLNIKDFELPHFYELLELIASLSEKYLLNVFLENPLGYTDNLLLLEKINSNNFYVTFDTGNAVALGINPGEFINKLKNKIGNVHIKDCDYSGKSVPLGDGEVNFAKIFNKLGKINYTGKYILEAVKEDLYYSNNNIQPKDTIMNYRNYLLPYLEK
jgi:hexulose-6-phosphate isomerase